MITCDLWFLFMMVTCDLWFWSMIVVFRANPMWYVSTWWFDPRCWFDLFWQEVDKIASVPYWQATNEVRCEFISIYFESNGNYVLGTGMHEHAWLGGWNRPQELATSTKGIRKCNNMHVKNFRSTTIVGHWYPIVSIGFHEHAMNDMMVLR